MKESQKYTFYIRTGEDEVNLVTNPMTLLELHNLCSNIEKKFTIHGIRIGGIQMKLIKPYFEIWEQEPGIQGIYKAIERAGRICYLSGDKITEDSAKPFVDRMVKSGHGAMLEHGTVYLRAPVNITGGMGSEEESCPLDKYRNNKYSVVHKDKNIYPDWLYVTTNYRVLIEQDWLNDLKYFCEPTEFHEKRVCVHFIADIGVLREFFRHRTMSMAQESTRYCNYSKDKFGNELTFIIPNWYNLKEGHYQYVHETGPLGHDFYWTPEVSYEDLENGVNAFLDSLAHSEVAYQELLNKWDNRIHDRRYRTGYKGNPLTPQQARAVLPLCTKSEAVMTGFISDWKHFFELRCPLNAHPQARELAIPLSEEFVKRKLIK